jgi:hypothetical protein
VMVVAAVVAAAVAVAVVAARSAWQGFGRTET